MAANDFNLRTDKYKSMEITASGDLAAGVLTKVEATIGVPAVDIANTATGALIYEADKIVVAKKAGFTAAVGAVVFYANNQLESSGDACGICLVAALTGDTTMKIDLRGADKSIV